MLCLSQCSYGMAIKGIHLVIFSIYTFTYIEKILYAAGDNTVSATLGKRDICANPVDVNEFDGS